uniref:Uncharacterized protein n=1 Tax=viral metagenome TaxID=1070528 RepID=A0A6C0BS21_9ZZZZ
MSILIILYIKYNTFKFKLTFIKFDNDFKDKSII